MRITCPSCSSAFEIPANMLGKKGRALKCASCGHSWYQAAQVESLDLASIMGEAYAAKARAAAGLKMHDKVRPAGQSAPAGQAVAKGAPKQPPGTPPVPPGAVSMTDRKQAGQPQVQQAGLGAAVSKAAQCRPQPCLAGPCARQVVVTPCRPPPCLANPCARQVVVALYRPPPCQANPCAAQVVTPRPPRRAKVQSRGCIEMVHKVPRAGLRRLLGGQLGGEGGSSGSQPAAPGQGSVSWMDKDQAHAGAGAPGQSMAPGGAQAGSGAPGQSMSGPDGMPAPGRGAVSWMDNDQTHAGAGAPGQSMAPGGAQAGPGARGQSMSGPEGMPAPGQGTVSWMDKGEAGPGAPGQSMSGPDGIPAPGQDAVSWMDRGQAGPGAARESMMESGASGAPGQGPGSKAGKDDPKLVDGEARDKTPDTELVEGENLAMLAERWVPPVSLALLRSRILMRRTSIMI